MDTCNIEHAWPEPVRALRKKYFTLEGKQEGKCQSFDFHNEQRIKNMKQVSGCSSFNEVVYAAAFEHAHEDMRKILVEEQGLRLPSPGRSDPSYQEDRDRAVGFFLDFMKREKCKNEILTLDDAVLETGDIRGEEATFTIGNLMGEGIERIQEYAPPLLRGKDVTFPRKLVGPIKFS